MGSKALSPSIQTGLVRSCVNRGGGALPFLLKRLPPVTKPLPAGPCGPAGPVAPAGPAGPAGPTQPEQPLKARYSGPPFPAGLPIPEAKVVLTPAGLNFRISPLVVGGTSATKRFPEMSKANPRGALVSPVAKTVLVVSGANLRISPLPGPSPVDAKRLPAPSKVSPIGP